MGKSNLRKFFIVLVVGVLLAAAYYFIMSNKAVANKYLNDTVTALNNENCTKLYPLNKVKDLSNEQVCPRGDIGNFMVVDKVEYRVVGLLGSQFGSHRQALITVCIKARGNAAWNEGSYDECTTDPRVISMRLHYFSWVVDSGSFTDLSKLLFTSGAKPEGYDKFRDNCIKFMQLEINNGGQVDGRSCNNAVESDIVYSIKTHKFVKTGTAH